MKFALTLAFTLLSSLAFANEFADTVKFLRETPAFIRGDINPQRTTILHQTNAGTLGPVTFMPVQVELRAGKGGVSFGLDEDSLRINTHGALVIKVGRIPITVENITYNAKTGKFTAKTSNALPFGDATVNSIVANKINELYKTKMAQAFAQIKNIRRQRGVDDIRRIITSVTSILGSGATGGSLALDVTGKVELVMMPTKRVPIKINNLNAVVKAGDVIATGFDFSFQRNRLLVTDLDFTSEKGIFITDGNPHVPEVTSIDLNGVKISRSGVTLDYVIGAERLSGDGLKLVLYGLIKSLESVSNERVPDGDWDCLPEVKIRNVRSQIEATFKKSASTMLRQYRKELIAAGLDPKLLDVLD